MKSKVTSLFLLIIISMCLIGCVTSRSEPKLSFSIISKSGKSSASNSSSDGKGGASGAGTGAAFTGEVVAGNAASANLTSGDVKAFIENYDIIFGIMNSDTENMAFDDVEAMLESCGISGPARSLKVAMIAKCESVMMFDAEMQADPQSAAVLKSMGMDPIADLRSETNAADMEVVKPYYGQLYILMNAE